jgi:hypothetical protein
MTSMFGPSRKQSTGQTSTQSVYLQRMQDSVTTWVMAKWGPSGGEAIDAKRSPVSLLVAHGAGVPGF